MGISRKGYGYYLVLIIAIHGFFEFCFFFTYKYTQYNFTDFIGCFWRDNYFRLLTFILRSLSSIGSSIIDYFLHDDHSLPI